MKGPLTHPRVSPEETEGKLFELAVGNTINII